MPKRLNNKGKVPVESALDILSACETAEGSRYTVQPETYEVKEVPLFNRSLPKETTPVPYDAGDNDVFIVSDLHISSGRNDAGVYPGTENFFADDSFERFLIHLDKLEKKRKKKAVLVLNGDTFDFVRNTEYPGIRRKIRLAQKLRSVLQGTCPLDPDKPTPDSVEAEYGRWCVELEKLGIKKTVEDLAKSIETEKEYGLGSEDFKAVYKLMRIRRGHPRFFTALARWLTKGNKLVFVKGNHDLELCHKNVRNSIRLVLAEEIAAHGGGNATRHVLEKTVLTRVRFFDDAVAIDDDVRIEHGHRHDKFTMVLDNPNDGQESAPIELPFGSLFNRYVINRVELFFPFLDNVRPAGNVLAMMIRMNLPLAVRIFFQHIPAVCHVMSKKWKYVWYMLQPPLMLALAVLVPVMVAFWTSPQSFWASLAQIGGPAEAVNLIFEQIKSIGLLILSYLLSRLVAWLQLTEPSSLDAYAEKKLRNSHFRILTMGHTHNPGQYRYGDDKRFYDTGTWIPVIETSTAEVRQDKTYTFLQLVRARNKKLQPANSGILQRWNDDACRVDSYASVGRK